MKPQIVIFSSSAALPIAEGLHAQLSPEFGCDLWKGDFFGENKTTPLWTFFKKLFHYDFVVLVLSDDNMIRATDGQETGLWVPKDNVVFELGACMARLGPQKTIMVTPNLPAIHLPSYFDDVEPLIYHYTNVRPQTKEHAVAATKNAADSIRTLLGSPGADTFHAELPAYGLAYAYQFNFLQPILNSNKAQVFETAGTKFNWGPADGLHITIAIPEVIMNRGAVGDYISKTFATQISNSTFTSSDGRNLSIYIANFKGDHQRLEIIDIPTTLLTTRDVIMKVEKFWRDEDNKRVFKQDDEFISKLEAREILNFERAMAGIKEQFADRVSIIPLNQLNSFLAAL
jgi:hypothetical protein